MRRYILCIFISVLFSSSVFCQFFDNKENNIKLSLTFPSSMDFDFSDGVIFRNTFCTGLDISYRHSGNRYDTGFFIDGGAYYPLILGTDYRYGSYHANFCTDYETLLGLNLFFGGYRKIKQDYNYKVPLGIGLHIKDVQKSNKKDGFVEGINEITVGPGIWASYERLLSDKFYICAGINVYTDFFRIKTTALNGALETLFKGVLYINAVPSLGVIYSF